MPGAAAHAAALSPTVDLRLLSETILRLVRRVDGLEDRAESRAALLFESVVDIKRQLGEIGFASGDALRLYREATDLRILVGDLASAVSDLGFAPGAAELLERELRQLRGQIEVLAAGLADLNSIAAPACSQRPVLVKVG